MLAALKVAGLFLSGLPKWVYWAIAAGVALAAAVSWHGAHVRAAYNAAYQQGFKDAADAIADEQAAQDRIAAEKAAKVEVKAAAISKEKSNALVETNRTIDARSAALSVQHAKAQAERDRASRDRAQAGEAASSAASAPACDGLPWSVALPLLTQAAKDHAQLNAVLDWIDEQEALDDAQAQGAARANPKTQ